MNIPRQPTCLQDEICMTCTVNNCPSRGIILKSTECSLKKEDNMITPYPDNFKEAVAINRNVVYTEATLNLVFTDADDCTFKSIRNFESDLLAKDWLKTCESQLRDMGFNKNTLTIHSTIKTVALVIEGKR